MTVMASLKSYTDSKTGCFANLRMSNGDPVYISVAQTGVLVKKSKLGLLGPILYHEKRVHEGAMTAKALAFLYPGILAPVEMTHPILRASQTLSCTANVLRKLFLY